MVLNILHDVFIAVLYLFGIGFVGFLAVFIWAMTVGMAKKAKEERDD